MHSGNRISFFVFLLAIPLYLAGLGKPAVHHHDELAELLEVYSAYFPQQKVYLHTDKEAYHVAESIWLKAYVVDAQTHRPDTLSGNLYVELIDNGGNFIRSSVLALEGGVAHNKFSLPDSLPDGNYFLRAYTNWMRNFPDELFFTRDIYIHNPRQENYIRWGERRQNRRFNRELTRKKEEMQFAVFPEGGHLVAGMENRVAFKAANAVGVGQEASGTIVDMGGKTIKTFDTFHDGMGVFSFIPQQDQAYRAKVQFGGGQQKVVPLPLPLKNGFLLQVDKQEEVLSIQVKVNFDPEDLHMPRSLFVILQNGGSPVFVEEGSFENRRYKTDVALRELPSGVNHITVFDGNGVPVAERLVFINNIPADEISVDHYITEEDDAPLLSLDLFLEEDHLADPGSYVLSVLSSPADLQTTSADIASYLLLTSDIAQTVENPSYYLESDCDEVEQALDLLMMTHGWRRFDWEPLLAHSFPEVRHGFASGLSVSGSVTALASAEPASDVYVEMIIDDKRTEPYSTTTGKEGRFVFSGLHYAGPFVASITTPYDVNGRNLWIDLDVRKPGKVPYEMTMHTRPESIVSRGDDWQRVRRPKTRMTPAEQAKPQLGDHFFGRPDQVVYGQDIEGHYNYMIDLLMGRITGLTIEGGTRLSFRGRTGVMEDDEPLYVVDGVMVHRTTFMSVNPSDLERLEVMRGSSAAIFGSRGGGGALLAFTKRGHEASRRTFEFVLTGYCQPETFYQSEINTREYQHLKLSQTLFWMPEIPFDPNGMTTVDVPLDSDHGNIFIFIEGLTNDGKPLFKRMEI